MVLVYELGGGTFDICVLTRAGNAFAPLILQGDMWLGGDDFDQVLVRDTVCYIKREYEIDPTTNKRFMVELKKAAQKTKDHILARSERNFSAVQTAWRRGKDSNPPHNVN